MPQLCPLSADPLELSKSNSAAFFWHDEQSFLNTKRIFAEIVYVCTDGDGEPLTPANGVSAVCPSNHAIVDQISINIGECLLQETPKYNQILSKMG